MTRLLSLIVAVLTLNACEQHKAADLPEEFRKDTKHDAAKGAGGEAAKTPAASAPAAH